MEKTREALDNLISKVVVNLSSSKLWTTLGGMLVAAFISYRVGGEEAALAAIAATLGLGGVYTAAKTYQNTHGANSTSANKGTTPIVEATSPTIAEESSLPNPTAPQEASEFIEPYDPMAIKLAGETALIRYEQIQDRIVSEDLTKYHPSIRLDFAAQILLRALSELIAAWREELARGDFTGNLPTREDLKSYETIQAHKNAVRITSPKCLWLPENIDTLYSELAKVYQAQDAISLLNGKPIAWYKNGAKHITTIEDIRYYGLGAVVTS